jgi:hypothetical protein
MHGLFRGDEVVTCLCGLTHGLGRAVRADPAYVGGCSAAGGEGRAAGWRRPSHDRAIRPYLGLAGPKQGMIGHAAAFERRPPWVVDGISSYLECRISAGRCPTFFRSIGFVV